MANGLCWRPPFRELVQFYVKVYEKFKHLKTQCDYARRNYTSPSIITLFSCKKIIRWPVNTFTAIIQIKMFRSAVLHRKTCLSAYWGSDHLPIVCYVRIKLRKRKKTKTTRKHQYDRLLNCPNCMEMYTDINEQI